jgi:outer membrane immunogenic protein
VSQRAERCYKAPEIAKLKVPRIAQMKNFVAGCVGFGVLLAAQCAGAADLSVAPLYKAPPSPYAQAYDWTGLYLGANGGGGWGHSRWDASGVSTDLSGGLVGGTLGYNLQYGRIVFGVEGDIDWAHLQGTGSSALCPAGCSTSDHWLSTVRGRLGYSFDRVMPYVTGGLAIGDISATTPGLAGASTTNTGYALGGGIEIALPGNWSAKAEYLHVDLGQLNCNINCGLPTDNVSMHDNIVRAGVNYRFGWGK